MTSEIQNMMENFDFQEMLHGVLTPILSTYCNNVREQPEAIWAETTKLRGVLVHLPPTRDRMTMLTDHLRNISTSADSRFLIEITLMLRLSESIPEQTDEEAFGWMMLINREIIGHRWCRDFIKRLSLYGKGHAVGEYLPPDEELYHAMACEPMSQMDEEMRMEMEKTTLIKLAHEALKSVDETAIRYALILLSNYGIDNGHTSDAAIKLINEHMRNYHAKQPVYIGQFNGNLYGNVQQIMLTEEERSHIPMLHLNHRMSAETTDGEKTRKESSGRKKENLFRDKNNKKNEALTEKMSKIFIKELLKQTEDDVMIEARGNNIPSALFIKFYQEWMNQGLVGKPVNGRTCYRFLTEDCELKCNTTEKYYSDWLKTTIESLM